MTSDIEKELTENMKEIEKLIDRQVFTTGDAFRFHRRFWNYLRKIEDLEVSRDKWKEKYEKLKGGKK